MVHVVLCLGQEASVGGKGPRLGEDPYILSAEKHEEDVLTRFYRLQESIIDTVTIRHLETIGVTKGWRCLEVGAGTGSIAQWLSTQVGSTGKVVATDIDTRFLQKTSAPNLEIRRHDILKDELESGEYDLAHCRKLLHHLHEPGKAVKKMANTLCPGGWFLIEEDDYGSLLSADITDPFAIPLVTAYRAVNDFCRKKGLADFYFGRQVRSLVEQLGFVDVDQEGWTMMVRGGDPQTRVFEIGWQLNGKIAIDGGVLTRDQVESLRRLLLDPTICFPSYTLFSAWGRKPVQRSRAEVGGDD
jgi:ubiquinone/menaquinone biosynthesis C-methylase UbiE